MLATTVRGETSFVTTLPATTMAPGSIVTSLSTIARLPIQT